MLWEPALESSRRSYLGRWCSRHGFATYQDAWEWSVAPGTAGEFWWEVARDLPVEWAHPPECGLRRDVHAVTGWRWFPGGRLNYAQHALRPPPQGPGALAVVARSQTRPGSELTWGQLAESVGRARRGLLAAGARPGDVVAGYLPNIPEALVAMLACASLGAVWASCAPEMGVTGALDRLAQLAPAVLLSVDGYRYGQKIVHRAEEAQAIRSGLPSLKRAVWLGYLEPTTPAPAGWQSWEDFVSGPGAPAYEAVSFEHPLYVLFSSGTTGKPKAITHGHGGILLEHAKALRFHFDLGPADRFFWFSTTGWMMWDFCVSGLLVGAAVVLFDGDPAWPGPGALWELVSTTGTTCAGVSAGYLVACMKAGLCPGRTYDLSALRSLGSTGSPLPAQAARWAYQAVKCDMMLASFSGGTDVCTGIVGPSPMHPVWAGEISCRCLGARVEVFDEGGQPVVGQDGELVLTAPMPSMPVGFWGDEDGGRYRAAYYEKYPGVWAHGDHARLTRRGTVVISGRSDGTLKRGGVRMGTAEFYSVVEALPEVADSLVVHVEDSEGGPGELWLFVVPAAGAEEGGDDRMVARVRSALRTELSPRHVPDHVVMVPAVPRTLSGKKMEVPVKRLLMGAAPGDVLAMASVADARSLEPLISLAAARARRLEGAAGGGGVIP